MFDKRILADVVKLLQRPLLCFRNPEEDHHESNNVQTSVNLCVSEKRPWYNDREIHLREEAYCSCRRESAGKFREDGGKDSSKEQIDRDG